MSWVKLAPEWLESDHIEALGSDAAVLHLTALGYSCRHATDGYLPQRAIRKLWPVDDLAAAVKALEESGEWEPAEDGWTLVNWADHLMSAAEVEHRREASRESSERYRLHQMGDHSKCTRCRYIKRGDASRDASVTGSVTPSRLDSTRLDSTPKGRGESETRRGSADADEDSARATSSSAQPPPEDKPPPRPLREDLAVHNWQPDHSGLSCAACGMPQRHQLHTETPLSGPAAWGRPPSRVIVKGGKK